MVTSRSTTTGLALALLLALTTTSSANAAAQWNPGTIEQSSVPNCNLDPEVGIIANAEFQSDPAQVPRVGEVFYVRTIPGRVGNGCGMSMAVHVEVLPPTGVTTAVSAATPVRCTYMDIDSGALTPAPACPQQPQSGVHGAAFDAPSGGG